MRHSIANIFYAIGRRLDEAGHGADGTIGVPYPPSEQQIDSLTINLHARDNTAVGAHFQPHSEWTYSALHIGGRVTIFLTRRFARNLATVLAAVEDEYREHGEAR